MRIFIKHNHIEIAINYFKNNYYIINEEGIDLTNDIYLISRKNDIFYCYDKCDKCKYKINCYNIGLDVYSKLDYFNIYLLLKKLNHL